MSSCRHLLASAFVIGLLAVPASASAEDPLGPLGSTTTIEETVAAETAPAVSIGSDKEDYAPGELVTLTGTGWQPGENVAISVVEDGTADDRFQHDATVVADASGTIVHSFNLPGSFVPLYHVTATGELSGVATSSFTDAISQYRQGTVAEAASTCANPGNALASDDQRATCERTAGTAEFVELSGFGLQNPVVPSTATNIGFQVEVEGQRSGTNRVATAALSWDNGANFTATQNTGTFNSSSDQTMTTLAPDGTTGRCQTFGRTWTYAELANFRVRVAPGGATSPTDFLDIDRVRVRVCYDGVNIIDAAVSSRTTAVSSPSGIVRGAVTVNLSGADVASTPDWVATSYQFGAGPETCVGAAPNPDQTGRGIFSANFDMTAPAARGVYDVKYRAYGNATCTGSPLHDEPFTLPGGLTVDIFGDSFGRDPAVNNYVANSWTDGDGAGANCSKQSQPVPPGIITPDAYLRLLNGCTHTRSNISTAGFGEVHLQYRWGQATDEAVPNGLVVEWKPSSEATWRSVESHALANSALTIPNSHDEDLGGDAEDTSIDIRFTGPPTGTGTVDSAAVDDVVVTGVPAVAVSGTKFDDQNVGLPGWTIKAYADDGAGTPADAGNGTLEPDEVTAGEADSDDTDVNGDYSLQLIPGAYVVCEEQETGWAQSAPSNAKCEEVDADAPGGHAVTVVASTPVTGQDFVNFEFATLSGSKFEDVNRDELWDPDGVDSGDAGDDEIALSGWTIEAYAPDVDGQATGSPVASTTTAGDGSYELKVPAGTYVICEQIQAGWTQSTPASPNKTCGGITGAAPGGHAATVTAGGAVAGKDFGNYRSGEVNGFKVDDQNRDGVLDRDGPDDDLDTLEDNEPILGGWTIEAYAADGNGDAIAGTPVDTDVTDVKGFYELTLPVGDWVICEQLQTGWEQSAPDPADEECAAISGAGKGGHFVQIAQGDLEADLDFGNYRTATVTVNKAYSDGTTTTPVTVELECTSGTVDPATDTAAPGSPAEFTVEGFAAGATCDVTEVDSPPGWTPDTSTCQDIGLTVGGTPQCTVTNVEDVSIVTAGGCTFDRMPDRGGSQFPLIFTPDNGAYYKLSSSNPGQFFLNVVYEAAAPGEDVTIDIPFPFVMSGTNAIKVHSDVVVTENNGRTCYSPAGTLLAQESDQITWNYASANFGDTQSITVDAPEAGLVFIRIHMAYDLKGRAAGCTKYGATAPHEARDCTAPRAGFDIGNAPTVGYEQYEFEFTGPNDDGGSTVESYNEFKKNPGIGGLVLAANSLTPFANAKADVYQGTKKVATVYTDSDGWYMWTYKYTGKATTFTVKLPNNGNASQSATLKSNGYLNIPFTLP